MTEQSSSFEDEGIPEPDEQHAGLPEDVREGTEPPRDTLLLSDKFGTTADEARAGESLDLKVGRELPDPALDPYPGNPAAADRPAGRLVEDDEGARADDVPESIARLNDGDRAGLSAEEAAMHIVGEEDAPGLTSGPDSYVDSTD